MAHYEAVLLNPDSRRIDIKRYCGHNHRTPETASRCGARMWGANRCQRVVKIEGDTFWMVGDTSLPIDSRQY